MKRPEIVANKDHGVWNEETIVALADAQFGYAIKIGLTQPNKEIAVFSSLSSTVTTEFPLHRCPECSEARYGLWSIELDG